MNETKICRDCEEELPIENFYVATKKTQVRRSWCKVCYNKKQALRRRSDPEKDRVRTRRNRQKIERRLYMLEYNRSEEQKAKIRARSAVSNAIRDGKLTRLPCEVCSSTDRIEAHHEDHSKPLEIKWLCKKHHWIAHGRVWHI